MWYYCIYENNAKQIFFSIYGFNTYFNRFNNNYFYHLVSN